jgi:mannose/cellobiose epimerase-like protein (N-acyl-D-glucosamine 2-epimerase family)
MPELLTRAAMASWMFESALPLWLRQGVDTAHGGFVEQLDFSGADAAAAFKRTRVTARQIYVFSHASLLGWTQGETAAAAGVDFLINRTWTGPETGFARRLSREGAVIDATPDLYDHAFALFALAWRHRASGDDDLRPWMHRTLDVIEKRFAHPGGEGFWHELPPSGWRLQNPHMHLTEACLAAFETTGESRFADSAHRMVDLFQTRFFDPASRTLAEYFTDDWRRAPGEDGRLVEPGHMMEWAWILNEARRLIGAKTAETIRSCMEFAETYGIDARDGVTVNAVRDDGVVLNAGSRTWPNCERIKGAVALFELDGVDPAPAIDAAAGLLLSRYLSLSPAGLWMDEFDGDRRGVAQTVPASTLYHVFLAFAEALRICR